MRRADQGHQGAEGADHNRPVREHRVRQHSAAGHQRRQTPALLWQNWAAVSGGGLLPQQEGLDDQQGAPTNSAWAAEFS